jgi:class 3 adenylate cyclase
VSRWRGVPGVFDSSLTPHSVFISDSTRELLQRSLDDLIFVDEFEVRGRQAKVKLWSIPEGAKS